MAGGYGITLDGRVLEMVLTQSRRWHIAEQGRRSTARIEVWGKAGDFYQVPRQAADSVRRPVTGRGPKSRVEETRTGRCESEDGGLRRGQN